MNKAKLIFAAAPIAFLVAACSQQAPTEADDQASAPAPAPTASASATPAAAPTTVLALEGLADLVVGQAVPKGSSFTAAGAQASDTCTTYSSPDFPGVYAIVEGGQVRRVTATRTSTLKLAEGIGAGSTEKEVLAAFPGFVATPHEYVAPPAKYLTQPGKDPRLMFEIGDDGKVTDVHVGLMPQLGYVEGCA